MATSAALATPINVAQLYGSATANETWSINYAENAIDNNNATFWNAASRGSTSDPNWLVVDLGTPFMVDAIYLDYNQPDGLYAGYTAVYSLFHGMNGADWLLIGSGTFVDENLNQISAEYLFPLGQSMRYVKYEVNGGSHWSTIAEIRVWAERQGTVPEPASLALLSVGLLGIVALRRKVVRF